MPTLQAEYITMLGAFARLFSKRIWESLDVFVEISGEDVKEYGIENGAMLEISTRRGQVEAPAKVGNILPGHLFLPFHYG